MQKIGDLNLKIEYLDIKKLKPYDKNAKIHDADDIEAIMYSIERFGMNDAIGIWSKDNVIVEGHGRLEACKNLGMKKVPCVRLDHLTDEERRAYALAHNMTAELSPWEQELKRMELNAIHDIDMKKFGFEDVDFESEEAKADQGTDESLGYYGDERERTINEYKLYDIDKRKVFGYYEMPIIDPCDFVPDNLIGFNYALTSKNKECGIHFYLDDYQFSQRVWTKTDFWVDKLREYQCVLTPDYSLYTEMPIAMKIWNVFRSRLIGQIFQRYGLNVIPTVSWCEKETYDFCFDGLPENATLSISTIGVKENTDAMQTWKDGVDEMIKRLHPKRILVYGGEVDYDYGNIEIIYYKNNVTENWE